MENKISLGNTLITVNLSVAALLLIINLTPEITSIRLFFGLPFLLFFPGYVLILALFPKQSALERIERLALSLGMSFVVTAVIGLILNYTPWGIRLFPILYSQSGYILLMSVVVWRQQAMLKESDRFTVDINLGYFSHARVFNKVLFGLLALSIITIISVFGYKMALPKTGEQYTEFYLLGQQRQGSDYPKDFVIAGAQVLTVVYDQGLVQAGSGSVTIGVTNHELSSATYYVSLTIDGKPAKILLGGNSIDSLGPITLANGQNHEETVSFAPDHAGANQEVDFILLVNGKPLFDSPPKLWINVTEVATQ